jgi:NAD(P)-dependent dehydrogenase (short-subunit alcohol dehydrogenase family)
MRDLSGKVALIAGGGHGIGRAMADVLAAEGMAVAVGDWDLSAAEAASEALRAAGARSLPLKLDVRDLAAWTAAADRIEAELGPVRLLCANAGVSSPRSVFTPTPIEDTPDEEWDYVLGVNLTGLIQGLRTFLPRFKARDEASHILATISLAGVVPQFAAVPASYTVSKYAAMGLFQQMRLELADFPQIGLTALCPGLVKTGIQANTVARADYLDETDRNRPIDNPYAKGGVLAIGIEPKNAARFAIDAVKEGRLYAFPHPEYGPLTKAYHARIEADFREPAQPGHIDPLPPL